MSALRFFLPAWTMAMSRLRADCVSARNAFRVSVSFAIRASSPVSCILASFELGLGLRLRVWDQLVDQLAADFEH
jgi:hypothetical protein